MGVLLPPDRRYPLVATVSTPEIDATARPSSDVVAPRSTVSNEIATINTSLTFSR